MDRGGGEARKGEGRRNSYRYRGGQAQQQKTYLEVSSRKVEKVRAVETQQITDQTVSHSSANSLSSLQSTQIPGQISGNVRFVCKD